MFKYEKKLQFPVNIKRPNPHTARLLLSQYGGADGELSSAIGYFSQRFCQNSSMLKALFTDLCVEELNHLEIIGAMIHQLTRGLSSSDIAGSDFEPYYVEHGFSVFAQDVGTLPFNNTCFYIKGDLLADLTNDLAAEQRSRATYEHLIKLIDDPDVREPLKYLREREIEHYQRISEALSCHVECRENNGH